MSFWQEKALEEMTRDEWEAICDGCGKCCLHSFIDSDEEDESFESTDFLREGEELLYTDVVCQYNDKNSCGCSRYSERQVLVPSCVQLTKENLKDIFFMPNSCSYRRLHEGRGLASWHPLRNNGSKQAMIDAGISIFGKATSELEVDLESDFEAHIVEWPHKDCE
ncbi:YcgN family cysteine cluster protein [Pseudoalteromonas sp. L23]|uniref:YcgN family cysteine cluster protein n=1 Tax=unclassified Pseudoalteromonas TaxID=194690 RepID=UPI001EF1268D|nr:MULTISPECIES: YcgN family cysteine cluster protein [unclassified Pseudoalteromonas]MCF7513397.1 YcgN family cysteine cluster protein [Pseudoalteromonas sp. L7]MCF7525626.1 YcgN family cysteine cluster protein [Pseudoalteromonas sp. L23]MCX2765861.1 YcgN family cysteine cluster protein [Pseudoalteromonas sp. B530]